MHRTHKKPSVFGKRAEWKKLNKHLFSMYYLCEMCHKPITVIYWVPRLTLLELETNWSYKRALGMEVVHTVWFTVFWYSAETPPLSKYKDQLRSHGLHPLTQLPLSNRVVEQKSIDSRGHTQIAIHPVPAQLAEFRSIYGHLHLVPCNYSSTVSGSSTAPFTICIHRRLGDCYQSNSCEGRAGYWLTPPHTAQQRTWWKLECFDTSLAPSLLQEAP